MDIGTVSYRRPLMPGAVQMLYARTAHHQGASQAPRYRGRRRGDTQGVRQRTGLGENAGRGSDRGRVIAFVIAGARTGSKVDEPGQSSGGPIESRGAVDRSDQVAEKPLHAFLDRLTLPKPLQMDGRCT